MSARYAVRVEDEHDRAYLIDREAPHAQKGTAPRVIDKAWAYTPEADALYVECDRLNAALVATP